MRVKGFQKVSSVVKCGSAAEEIIRVAEQIPEAFIAMCAHGRSGIRRWMLGSVAEKVVRHSGHSVLIVRAT
jgi:nucleotide-binding universal stress UspA family protein